MTATTEELTLEGALARAQELHPLDLVERVDFIQEQLDERAAARDTAGARAWGEALEITRNGRLAGLVLSKEDLGAIRRADEIDAHLDDDGRHWLTCIKRRTYQERETNPFCEDQTIRIEVQGGVVEHVKNETARPLVAYANITNRFGGGCSLDRLVSAGDRVRLRWVRGNNSPALLEHGCVRDELQLEILRKEDVHGRRPIHLLCDVRVGPDNTARMIRPKGW